PGCRDGFDDSLLTIAFAHLPSHRLRAGERGVEDLVERLIETLRLYVGILARRARFDVVNARPDQTEDERRAGQQDQREDGSRDNFIGLHRFARSLWIYRRFSEGNDTRAGGML